MSTKELILAELDSLSQQELDEFYRLVKQFLETQRQRTSQPAFLERLSQIQIDGPEDFAENIDFYLIEEKRLVQAGFTASMKVEN